MKIETNSYLPEIIVFLLQNTEEDLFDYLLELSQPVIHRGIKEIYLKGYEKEDLIQEGHMILAIAVYEYDFESPLRFFRYFIMMFMNHLYKQLRKQDAQKRKANAEAYSLDALTENLGIHIQGTSSEETNPESAFLLKEAYSEYNDGLSKFEEFVYTEYMAGKSVVEIAKNKRCDETKIKGALYRCRRKLSTRLQ